MRIAWFIHRYFPCIGGSENFGREMVRRFVASGAVVDVATSDAHDLGYFTDPKGRRVDAPHTSVVDGAHVTRFAVRHRPAQRYLRKAVSYLPHWPTRCRVDSFMPIIPRIEDVRGDYDVAVAVGFPYTQFAYAAWKTARAAGAPLVLIPFLHLATPGDRVNRGYTRPHQIRLLREADLVVAATDLEADAIAGWGVPRSRLLTLGMAVDHPAVTGGDGGRLRDSLGLDADARLVGQLGALDRDKGTDDLVRAMAALNARRDPTSMVHLALAGSSTPRFDAFAADLPPGSSRWLHRLGPVSAVGVADFYDAIDVFAMPSRTDSFGIVFLEAWANGKPVVAATAGGVAEVVEHDRTGRLVPFGNVPALSCTLARLVDHPAEARRLGEAGRAKVAVGHTWDDRFLTLRERIAAIPRR